MIINISTGAYTMVQEMEWQMEQRWLEAMAQSELFRGLTPDQLDVLIPCFNSHVRPCDKGEVICLAGQSLNSIGLVLSGEIVVQEEDGAGNRLIIGMFGPGELFGEVAAFAGAGSWPNTVVAFSPGHVLFIPVNKITRPCCKVCNVHQQMIRNMLGIVAGKAMLMHRRLNYIKLKGMREKLAAYLHEQYRLAGTRTFHTSMNREALADFLNVSRPSMSRELGRMKEDGLIDFFRSSFTIKDPERLLLCLTRDQ